MPTYYFNWFHHFRIEISMKMGPSNIKIESHMYITKNIMHDDFWPKPIKDSFLDKNIL